MSEYKHARYDSHTYYTWLIERFDRPRPEWLAPNGEWTTHANGALWFARREDADKEAGEMLCDARVVEHGFDLNV